MSRRAFIHEPIAVTWGTPPPRPKSPPAPDRFTWREMTYVVTKVRSAWQSFERRGRMRRNMRPENLRRAASRGSFGVGEFHFEVEAVPMVEDDAERASDPAPRTFAIYYDRRPKNPDEPGGQWFLAEEILAEDSPPEEPPGDDAPSDAD